MEGLNVHRGGIYLSLLMITKNKGRDVREMDMSVKVLLATVVKGDPKLSFP